MTSTHSLDKKATKIESSYLLDLRPVFGRFVRHFVSAQVLSFLCLKVSAPSSLSSTRKLVVVELTRPEQQGAALGFVTKFACRYLSNTV